MRVIFEEAGLRNIDFNFIKRSNAAMTIKYFCFNKINRIEIDYNFKNKNRKMYFCKIVFLRLIFFFKKKKL